MLSKWQFNILFFVGVGGAIVLLLGPEMGLDVSTNPLAVSGVGAILTYILTQKDALTKPEPPKRQETKAKEEVSDNGSV